MSRSTVSFVLNRVAAANIGEVTRARVRAAVLEHSRLVGELLFKLIRGEYTQPLELSVMVGSIVRQSSGAIIDTPS